LKSLPIVPPRVAFFFIDDDECSAFNVTNNHRALHISLTTSLQRLDCQCKKIIHSALLVPQYKVKKIKQILWKKEMKQPTMKSLSVLNLLLLVCSITAFSVVPRSHSSAKILSPLVVSNNVNSPRILETKLYMSDRERSRSTKKGVTTIEKDKVESQAEQKKRKEEMWRVILHNDEVHTFNYVIRSLCKVIGTLDRKASFEICVQTHGIGKATVTKTWKKQAEQFCLGLQRQGLTVSISPDKDFDGGHSGGGL
jgi:ATP-dependent Clp protease adapter protein ClpS